jgi:RimJ/RimL family protein N-acetyltransferase
VTSLPHAEPVFETERLAIRDWQPEDVDRMLDMYSRADVVRFLGSVPTPMTSRELADERIARALSRNTEQRAAGSPCGWWAVTARSGGVVVGTVALHPDSQGHGYATEAARGALDRGHAAGLPEVLALTDERNTASQAVCRRLGLELQGVSEQFYGRPLLVWVSRV